MVYFLYLKMRLKCFIINITSHCFCVSPDAYCSENGARLLFDVFGSRYEKGSIAVSTNLSFDKWVEVFGTTELTAALVDQFTHKCIILSYQGKSVRFLDAKKRKEDMKVAY